MLFKNTAFCQQISSQDIQTSTKVQYSNFKRRKTHPHLVAWQQQQFLFNKGHWKYETYNKLTRAVSKT